MQLQGRKAITAEDFHNAYLSRQGELMCVRNGLLPCVWGGHIFIVLLCLDTRLTLHKHKYTIGPFQFSLCSVVC